MGHHRQGMEFRQIRKILEKDSWRVARVTGGHYMFQHPQKKGTVVVPFRNISKNVELHILRNAGLR